MKRLVLICLIWAWLIQVCYIWEHSNFGTGSAEIPIGNNRKVKLYASHETWWEPRHGQLGIEVHQWDSDNANIAKRGYWVIWNKWVWIPF